ncbi:MAG TPA: hypothetical protein DHV68_05485 [Dehalococcoidia bacterium]|nr:hypothetical protein [Dehalococcoidia bacterium]
MNHIVQVTVKTFSASANSDADLSIGTASKPDYLPLGDRLRSTHSVFQRMILSESSLSYPFGGDSG